MSVNNKVVTLTELGQSIKKIIFRKYRYIMLI